MFTMFWATVIILGILITIHEYGHFKAARSVGVRVEKFSIGIPPRFITIKSLDDILHFKLYFFKWTNNRLKWSVILERKVQKIGRVGSSTEYVIALVPIGGYVKMAGMLDESMDSDIKYENDEFMVKPLWAKLWILSAGVLMNTLLAFLIFASISLYQGKSEILNKPIIESLQDNMPAKISGLQTGDKIISINNENIDTWNNLTSIIHSKPNKEISLLVQRENKKLNFNLTTSSTTMPINGKIDTIGLIGITPKMIYSDITILESIKTGYERTFGSFGMMIMSIKMIGAGDASMSDFGGPIMIAQLAGQTAEAGWVPFLTFMALISINLAFINILPIPGLDGGHIFLHLIESIIRRPLTLETRIRIQQIGMSFLLVLMVTVMFNDIARLFN
jgi:regulator of sigma E protease